MKKKQYIIPSTNQWLLSTAELMRASGTSPDLPPGPGNGSSSAPRRKTEVF